MTTPQFNSDDATEQLLGQVSLDTTSGFIPPYRHFEGTVLGFKSRFQQSKANPNNQFLIVSMQVGGPNFHIHASTVPWESPTLEHELVLFNPQEIRENSLPGVFLSSAKKCLGNKSGLKLPELKGKHIEVMYTKDHAINQVVGFNDATQKNIYDDVPSMAFEVVAVDGQKNPSPHEPWGSTDTTNDRGSGTATSVATVSASSNTPDYSWLIEILDGKTQADFESSAFTDQRVQADMNLFNYFSNGTINALINSWLEAGLVAREGDGEEAVYKKIA